MLSHNPYIAGNPTTGPQFVGRDDILRQVERFLSNPHENALVLYGQRRIGKTSILLQIEESLENAAQYTPVYFDLQDRAGKPLADVLYELAQRIAHKVHEPVPGRDEFDADGVYFKESFLPRVAEKAQAGGLVLLFDEFDVLGNHGAETTSTAGDEFFPYLRQWMTDVADVNFIFVIGRRPEDLSINTMQAFKSTRTIQVSTMDRTDTERVIRQSAQQASMNWQDKAVQAVWDWTNGHPYLTQLLCYVVWENVVDDHEEQEAEGTPLATETVVNEAVPEALQQGANAFQWIWDGLPPAEKIVMAAMAGSDEEALSKGNVEQILLDSGVQLIVGEVEVAPDKLTEWGLLAESDQQYRFRVPLLREWTKRNRPLRQVKDELDRLDPLADQLYQAGRGYYNLRQLDQASNQLQQAIDINPNHLKANVLLARVYLEQEHLTEARELLERLMQYDPASARTDLVRVLLAQARQAQADEEKFSVYDHILTLSPQQPVARKYVIDYLKRLGNSQQDAGTWTQAQETYRTLLTRFPAEGDWQQQLDYIDQQKRREELAVKIAEAEAHRNDNNWVTVATIYRELLTEFPEEEGWQTALEEAETEAKLSELYQEALGALEVEANERAREKLLQILQIRPTYERASFLLVQATQGVDVTQLQKDNAGLLGQLKKQQSRHDKEKTVWEAEANKLIANIEEREHANREATIQFDEAKAKLGQQTNRYRLAIPVVIIAGLVLFGLYYFANAQTQAELTAQQAVDATTIAELGNREALAETRTADQRATSDALSLQLTASALEIAGLLPTETPTPTNTPQPTDTPDATATPSPTATATPDPNVPPPEAELGDVWVRPMDEMIMVYVPSGTFMMGNEEVDNESPIHEVTLDGFWIDQTEVTNAQYAQCVADGVCDPSSLADDSDFNGAQQPVVSVSWFDADTYCTWSSEEAGRLPTEAEWEYAARGPDSRTYPWGNDTPTCNLAQFGSCGGETVEVGSFSPAGDSWIGAQDMAGNVWEWVNDWYDSNYYDVSPIDNPQGPGDTGAKVMRGGSWGDIATNLRSSNRSIKDPTNRNGLFGFRCAHPGS